MAIMGIGVDMLWLIWLIWLMIYVRSPSDPPDNLPLLGGPGYE